MNSAGTVFIAASLALITADAAAAAPSRAESDAPLATIHGSTFRVVDHGAPDDWLTVGDETSLTVGPGVRVEVRGWWSRCNVRDSEGRTLDWDLGLLTASCEVPA